VDEDLERIEERGCMAHANAASVSERARKRQQDEMGTLGSGNHYLEVQEVTAVFDESIAGVFGLGQGDIVLMIHCGSRGLGHQIGTEFLKRMVTGASQHGIVLPDRELACAPISSELCQEYLGAMRARSTARSRTGRFLRIWCAASSRTSCQGLGSGSFTMFRTIPARWKSTARTALRSDFTLTVKGRRVRSVRGTRPFRNRCARRPSRC
jgi:RNA-splicing ligase RtcB